MSIIKTHDVTLYGGNDVDIVLRPLCDEYLPYLYKWNADPEVLYWTEGGEDIVLSYDKDTVHHIYGGVSQNAFCFLIEVNGTPIGECWLQKMNLPDVRAMYPETVDVRRIDMAIGEKNWWGKGIGTQMIGMMIDFAFNGEHVDILHCFSEDYNVRSWRMWQKYGFTLVRTDELPQLQKGKLQYHFALTREEYIAKRRIIPPIDNVFEMQLLMLQPSQLYISEGKQNLIREWFNPSDRSRFDPIPVIKLDGRTVMTDGHTRAVAAYLAGWESVPVYWDTNIVDMRPYSVDISWCDDEGIGNPADHAKRVVSHNDYERLWRKRCMELMDI